MTTIEAHPLGRAAFVLAAASLVFLAALATNDGVEGVPADATATPGVPTATASPEVTSTPAATSTSTVTPEPTPTPRPGPEPAFGELPPSLEVSQAGMWVRQTLAAGEEPTPNHGVLIRDLETGGGEHWSLADGPEPGAEFFAYGVAGDGRFATFGNPFEAQQLADRETGLAVGWNLDTSRFLAGSSDGRILLATTEPQEDICLFWAVDLDSGEPEPLLRFGVPGDRFCTASAVFGAPGTDTLTVGANSGDTVAYAVALQAGTVRSTADATVAARLGNASDPTVWFDTSGAAQTLPIELTISRYDAATDAIAVTGFNATADGAAIRPVLTAPNSRFVAWQESLRLGGAVGLGGWAEWPVTVIGDSETGEVLLRVVRAALITGSETTAWLGDSSGIVLAAEGEFVLLEFALTEDGIDVSSATLTSLSFEHETHSSPRPEPSPADRSLFAYDGRFVDTTGTELLPPLVSDWARSGPLSGEWTSSGSEYYLATWARGAGDFGDGPLAPIGLAPRLQLPPFSNEVRLVVTEATELRQTFALDSPTSWALEASTVVTVENDGSARECFAFGCAALIDRGSNLDPRPWWLFVRTEDGRAGWADSSTLAWAD